MKIRETCFGAEIGSKILDTRIKLDENWHIVKMRGQEQIGTVVGKTSSGNYSFLQVDFNGHIRRINVMDDAQCLGRYHLIEEE